MSVQFQGVFAKIEFPPYSFREYPKWITIGGAPTLVHTQREELALIAETPEAASNDPVVVEKNKLATALLEERTKANRLERELAELRAQAAGPTITISSEASPQPKPADDLSAPVPLDKTLAEKMAARAATTKP